MSATPVTRRTADLAAFRAYASQLQEANKERQEVCIQAMACLDRLVAVCATKTGQAYTLRGLLYSLWNGQAFSLLEVVTLDWAIRKDLNLVLLAFGFEGRGASFFYDQVQEAFQKKGLFDWFCAAHEEVQAA